MPTRVQPVLTSPLNRTPVVAPAFALRLSMAATNSEIHRPWLTITTWYPSPPSTSPLTSPFSRGRPPSTASTPFVFVPAPVSEWWCAIAIASSRCGHTSLSTAPSARSARSSSDSPLVNPIVLTSYRFVHLDLILGVQWPLVVVVVRRYTPTLLLPLLFRYWPSRPELSLGDTKVLLTDQGRSVYRRAGERVLVWVLERRARRDEWDGGAVSAFKV